MKTLVPLLLVSCLAMAEQAKAPRTASAPAPAPSPWNLIFSDEFNGPDLDLTKWAPHGPAAHVEDASPASIDVKDGQLHIVSRSLIGGTVTTFGMFSRTFGRFEIRCKIPGGKDLRSRVRLLPLSLGLPGIDVFEADGGAPSKVFFGNHWGTEQTERSFGDSFAVPDLSSAFHVMAVEWDADKIAWFVDGKKRFESFEGVPKQPLFLAIELAGTSPAPFDIDYVRVYERR